ncbi:MAG: DUF4332 domain-containing protein [Akkermansiaceae bacterium]
MAAGDLSNISGLGKLSIELLETIGVDSLVTLSKGDADQLLIEMIQANRILNIRKKAPTTVELQKWIEQARDLTGYDPDSEVVKLEEVVPEIEEVLVAIPVNGKDLVSKGIKASEVPAIEIMTRQERPNLAAKPQPTRPKHDVAASVVKNVRTPAPKKEVKPRPKPHKEIAPLQAKEQDIRTRTSKGLNDGKKEHSRSYIRGVLYPQAGRLKLAAFIAILFFMSLPVAMLGVALIVLNDELLWVIAPVATAVLGLLYLMFATKVKCRICGQPLYVSKGCNKHVKAHYIPVLGYILPTSLQLLFFKWFRCIYCGTSIRTKE